MMPAPPSDWLGFLERLSQASFGLLVGVALVGSYFGIWLWGRQHRERVAELVAQIAKLEASEKRWQDMAIGLLTPLEQVRDHLSGKRG